MAPLRAAAALSLAPAMGSVLSTTRSRLGLPSELAAFGVLTAACFALAAGVFGAALVLI